MFCLSRSELPFRYVWMALEQRGTYVKLWHIFSTVTRDSWASWATVNTSENLVEQNGVKFILSTVFGQSFQFNHDRGEKSYNPSRNSVEEYDSFSFCIPMGLYLCTSWRMTLSWTQTVQAESMLQTVSLNDIRSNCWKQMDSCTFENCCWMVHYLGGGSFLAESLVANFPWWIFRLFGLVSHLTSWNTLLSDFEFQNKA